MTSQTRSISTLWQNALGAVSERGQYGLVVLASLAGLYALSSLSDANTQARLSLDNAERQLNARQAALEQRDWLALADEAEQLALAAEARFWRAPTEGIAAARIQGALEEAGRLAGLRNVRVQVIAVGTIGRSESAAQTRLFEAEVTALDSGGAFAPFIEAAASAQGELRAVRLDWDSRTRRFTVGFIAPALMEPTS